MYVKIAKTWSPKISVDESTLLRVTFQQAFQKQNAHMSECFVLKMFASFFSLFCPVVYHVWRRSLGLLSPWQQALSNSSVCLTTSHVGPYSGKGGFTLYL
jgi:hypothetical protein